MAPLSFAAYARCRCRRWARTPWSPYPSLGSGAFVAGKRYLAFLRDDRVITLETFPEEGARYVLTTGELAELARALQ